MLPISTALLAKNISENLFVENLFYGQFSINSLVTFYLHTLLLDPDFYCFESPGARNLAAVASVLTDGWVFIVTSPAPRDTSAEIAKTSVTAKTEHLATTSPVRFF